VASRCADDDDIWTAFIKVVRYYHRFGFLSFVRRFRDTALDMCPYLRLQHPGVVCISGHGSSRQEQPSSMLRATATVGYVCVVDRHGGVSTLYLSRGVVPMGVGSAQVAIHCAI